MRYLLPEGADAESVRITLSEHLDVRPGHARSIAKTYFDTFDGRLYSDGLTLRHADGRLTLIDRATGETFAAAEATAAPRLFDRDLPGELREPLEDVIEMRALVPVARVRS